MPVRYYDLSMDGCMIELAGETLSEGNAITLQLAAQRVAGTVLWSRDHSACIAFRQPLSGQLVAKLTAETELKAAPAMPVVKRPARQRLAGARLPRAGRTKEEF